MSSSDHAPVARPSIGALLREQANALGEREFLRFEGRRATFAEIESESNRLANALRRHGVERGDRVAIMLPNGLEFPIAWLAVLKVGAAAVSANVQYRDADLSYVLRDSGAALVVTDTHRAELVLRVAKACPGLRAVGVSAGEGKLSLLGEFAAQSDAGDNPADFDADPKVMYSPATEWRVARAWLYREVSR